MKAPTVNLYRVQFDGEPEHVEAIDFAAAIRIWHAHLTADNPDHDMSEDQPESVELIGYHPVLRELGTTPTKP